MPIYEYKCRKCGAVFEQIIISKHDASEISCRKCGSNLVRKTISAASLKLSSHSAGSIPSGAFSGGCSSSSGFS
ncbi:MAG TPA: zinc ribbon domain-containing protein [Desulfobacterales bacterium]|nr:zinc ribbon domain-containing protein [Desulfobacterales bacterium]